MTKRQSQKNNRKKYILQNSGKNVTNFTVERIQWQKYVWEKNEAAKLCNQYFCLKVKAYSEPLNGAASLAFLWRRREPKVKADNSFQWKRKSTSLFNCPEIMNKEYVPKSVYIIIRLFYGEVNPDSPDDPSRSKRNVYIIFFDKTSCLCVSTRAWFPLYIAKNTHSKGQWLEQLKVKQISMVHL